MDNYINGEGAFYWKDGRIYIGKWNNNKMNGYGVFIWPDKKKYYGNYINNAKEGYGIFFGTMDINMKDFGKKENKMDMGLYLGMKALNMDFGAMVN